MTTDQDAYRQQQERKERLDKLAYRNVHAILAGEGFPCGGNLSVAWGGLAGRQEYVLRCAKCGILPDDTPLEKIETPYDVWKAGGIVAPWHQATYEKLKKKEKENRKEVKLMSTELTTISEGQVGVFNPEAHLDMAIRAAKALSRVIAQKKKPVILNGEQYLEFEDWQTLGQFDGVSVRTGDAEPVEINGVQGAKAKAYLYKRTGELIGGAEAYCMRDEEHWNTRPKYEWQGEGNNRLRVKVGDEVVPWFQLASMAQTRAGAKALRNKEAWIAVLAGYRPTPAEEMTEGTVSEAVEERRTVDKSQHWCVEHQVVFFKRGNMKNFAHPIGETGKWCNETKRAEPVKPTEAAEEFDDIPSVQPATKATGDQSDLSKLEFANIGQFYQACNDHFNLSKTQVMKEVPEFDLSNAGQRARAWQQLLAVYAPKKEVLPADAKQHE